MVDIPEMNWESPMLVVIWHSSIWTQTKRLGRRRVPHIVQRWVHLRLGGTAEYDDGPRNIGAEGSWSEDSKKGARAKLFDKVGEWVGEWTGGDTPFYYYGEREDRERTQWLAGNSGDGFLVWDHNKDGRITDASELMSEFGRDGSVAYASGFEKLEKLFDKDHDGVIKGGELNSLRMWVDDGDAVTQAGELKTLKNLVTEIFIPKDEETMASTFKKEVRSDKKVDGGSKRNDVDSNFGTGNVGENNIGNNNVGNNNIGDDNKGDNNRGNANIGNNNEGKSGNHEDGNKGNNNIIDNSVGDNNVGDGNVGNNLGGGNNNQVDPSFGGGKSGTAGGEQGANDFDGSIKMTSTIAFHPELKSVISSMNVSDSFMMKKPRIHYTVLKRM